MLSHQSRTCMTRAHPASPAAKNGPLAIPVAIDVDDVEVNDIEPTHPDPIDEVEQEPGARGSVLLIVSNPFFRDDGWHDIRVHKFARTFQRMGFAPTVYCRTYPDAASERGVYDGIPYRRMRFSPPVQAKKQVVTDALSPEVAKPGFVVRAVRRVSRRFRSKLNRLRNIPRRLRRRIVSKYLGPLNTDFTNDVVMGSGDMPTPAFVYAADISALRAGDQVAQRWNVPFLYDSHEYFISQSAHSVMGPVRRRVNQRLVRWLESKYFPRATVMSVSPSIIEAFRERMPGLDYHCIRNLPLATTRVPRRQNLIREQLGLPDDVRIALYIGFITSGRGIDEMIDAGKHLPDNIVVAMLGGGRLIDEARDRIANAGLQSKVHLLGHVPQARVMDYAESADCGLCLIQNTCQSYYFCLPNKVFQYIHAGLPVLCSDFPDLRGLVERRGVGRWADPSDPESIAREIVALVDDAAALDQMRESCFRAVADELNWEAECRRLEQIEFLAPKPR